MLRARQSNMTTSYTLAYMFTIHLFPLMNFIVERNIAYFLLIKSYNDFSKLIIIKEIILIIFSYN